MLTQSGNAFIAISREHEKGLERSHWTVSVLVCMDGVYFPLLSIVRAFPRISYDL